jgi:hypothetical protein
MSDALSVLLIDDNPDDRILVLREIRKVLPDVVADEVGEQSALEEMFASGRQWDIAITDYQLRWSTGLEIFHRLRARQPELPVIMFTPAAARSWPWPRCTRALTTTSPRRRVTMVACRTRSSPVSSAAAANARPSRRSLRCSAARHC